MSSQALQPATAQNRGAHPRRQGNNKSKGNQRGGGNKPGLAMDDDPAAWLGFSLPPRSGDHGHSHGPVGPPRRSKRGDAWRGSVLTREKFVNASYRFALKPSEAVSYGAHFADPDIALHWPNILQVLVPTFSSYSIAQGFVATDAEVDNGDDGEDASSRRQRMEEERQGRSCPICLSKPVAGRMTKCGHIFCFPCILHFIQLSDVPKSASCPICGDTIHEGMLKSVRYLDAETMVKAAEGEDLPDEAESSSASTTTADCEIAREARLIDSEPATRSGSHRIHMRLMQRPQMTTMALPPTATWPSEAIPQLTAPWHFLPDVLTYSRFMLASPDYMMGELQREMDELKGEWDLLAGDDLGRSFVRSAKDKVERQIGKVKAELMTELVRHNEAQAREAWGEAVGGERLERQRRRERERRAREREEREREKAAREQKAKDDAEVPIEFLATTAGAHYVGPTVHVPANVTVEPNPMPAKRNKRRPLGGAAPAAPPTPPAQSYYFYQSSLGANVFLNPLDIRILLAHFQSYSLFPAQISFTTTGYDSATVNDDLRRRCKYLSHLPVGTEVVFVEADLSNIVSAETLAQFEQPLKARRNKRRDRARREDRDKRRWEEAERAKRPAEMHTVASALAPPTSPGAVTDRDLALALAASMDTDLSRSPDLSTSPVAAGSFAWAVHSRTTPSAPQTRTDRDNMRIVEEALAFDQLDEAEPATGGKKKKGGKKAKKIVLGGAGRQA
ncbi:hypothetical protein Q8F55_005757 [Vanrija albida]|uniref:RING-type domain-containing protein n=1 Tax=Vanrija albida TaxID=181172 RepID=A0ABR3Q2Q8_9TREE